MTAYQLFLLILTIYIGILIATGLYFSKRQKTLTDFWLAGKDAGFLSLGFSAAASWLTAGALLAVIGFFLLQGLGSIWGFVAPNILALLIIGFLVRKIKKLPAITQPELLEMRYGSILRLPVALIITVVMVLFAVADIKGFAMVLQIFYGVSPVHAALIVGLAVAVYVTLGGLSAVIATDVIQYLCLAVFVLIMAIMVMSGASEISAHSTTELFTSMPESWWNPLSIGMPMVLIFVVAIIPGWISEQDPWQRVWAARNERSARNGMFFGALLVALIFGGCAVIAVGLNTLYPDIAALGFPMGMVKAEPALLSFIMERGFSDMAIAFCAVALATAAMSCTDTFATSGASCIARDIYQRYLKPDATMKEMGVVNRLSVLVIIVLATCGSLYINSIIDAIHIATFIASASYFFVLMGGLYWKRATSSGAAASLCAGFGLQAGLVLVDLTKTAPMAPPYLESLHPLLMGHGVIIAMAVSGAVFIGVSLATEPSRRIRLVPFFPEERSAFAATIKGERYAPIPEGSGVLDMIDVRRCQDVVRLHLSVDFPGDVLWRQLTTTLSNPAGQWFCLAGAESIQRFGYGKAGKTGGAGKAGEVGEAGFHSCVTVSRGDSPSIVWFETEGRYNHLEQLKEEIYRALVDTETVFETCRKQQSGQPVASRFLTIADNLSAE